MSSRDIFVTNVTISVRRSANRVPLKFGREVTTHFSLCRACCAVAGADGGTAEGVGETPVATAWSWPSAVLTHQQREARMLAFCEALGEAWSRFGERGHPMEIGYRFLQDVFPSLLARENEGRAEPEKMPYLAALVCNSLFDLALHDAYGALHRVRTFDTYNAAYMNHDLSWYYGPPYRDLFAGKYPQDFFLPAGPVYGPLPAWHLVGAKDPIDAGDLTGEEPDDGYPVLLRDWIAHDGLRCLKIKLTGIDAEWDYRRIARVGRIAREMDVPHLTCDFNCTVEEPAYVCALLDRLQAEEGETYDRVLYVEQPFPYEIETYPIDVTAISARKPLFMDESAHDWRFVAMGHRLGWTGVALKTCKTLTGALLSLCWGRANGMLIMVQDLTNPKLATIPHALLAASVGTIMGVEVNAMQFCPEISRDEARVHPGLYRRRNGAIDLSTLGDTGLGYRLDEIAAAKRAAGEGAL